jgi:thiol-disulfide isomerase/thioredoxin
MNRRHLLAMTGAISACGLDSRQECPDFRARSLDGQSFTKKSLKGKVVLVQMWATWCGYCRREQPIIDSLLVEFGGKGLVLLAVNVGESRAKVLDYLRDSPRRPHIVLESDTDLADQFHSGGFPTYVVVDRDGKIAGAQRGAGGEEGLRGMLAKAGLAG